MKKNSSSSAKTSNTDAIKKSINLNGTIFNLNKLTTKDVIHPDKHWVVVDANHTYFAQKNLNNVSKRLVDHFAPNYGCFSAPTSNRMFDFNASQCIASRQRTWSFSPVYLNDSFDGQLAFDVMPVRGTGPQISASLLSFNFIPIDLQEIPNTFNVQLEGIINSSFDLRFATSAAIQPFDLVFLPDISYSMLGVTLNYKKQFNAHGADIGLEGVSLFEIPYIPPTL